MKSIEGKIVDKSKLDYEIDWEFITLLAERMQKGKEKYGPYSWHGPTDVKALKRAYFRHTLEIMKGNYLDDGQEYGHIGAAVANLMMIYYQLTHNISIVDKTFTITKQLIDQFPNDQTLGQKVRELIK
jgi:hypothetical protein